MHDLHQVSNIAVVSKSCCLSDVNIFNAREISNVW